MRHHLHSIQSSPGKQNGTHTHTHTHMLGTERGHHTSRDAEPTAEKRKYYTRKVLSPTSTLVESTLQSAEKVSCSVVCAFLSVPFCLGLHAFICQTCVCIPTYVSSSVAEPETQMAPRWRQITKQASATLHSPSLSKLCLSLSFSFFNSLAPSDARLLRSSYGLPLPLFYFSSTRSLSLSMNLRPLLRLLSLALSLPPSQSLAFSLGSTHLFPYTVPSSVFMDSSAQRTDVTPLATTPHPLPPHGS